LETTKPEPVASPDCVWLPNGELVVSVICAVMYATESLALV
jgi:hypothetical protein